MPATLLSSFVHISPVTMTVVSTLPMGKLRQSRGGRARAQGEDPRGRGAQAAGRAPVEGPWGCSGPTGARGVGPWGCGAQAAAQGLGTEGPPCCRARRPCRGLAQRHSLPESRVWGRGACELHRLPVWGPGSGGGDLPPGRLRLAGAGPGEPLQVSAQARQLQVVIAARLPTLWRKVREGRGNHPGAAFGVWPGDAGPWWWWRSWGPEREPGVTRGVGWRSGQAVCAPRSSGGVCLALESPSGGGEGPLWGAWGAEAAIPRGPGPILPEPRQVQAPGAAPTPLGGRDVHAMVSGSQVTSEEGRLYY